MATIYLAIDNADGLTLPAGEIVGMSDSEQGLRDAGFAASTYTGNRLTTVDDTAAGWNADAVPGWYLTSRTNVNNYAIGPAVPPTDIQDLQNAIRAFQAQVVQWSHELNLKSIGQPQAKVAQGHARLYSALGAMYLICRNTTNSLTDRKAYATLMRRGAADIQKPDDFYTEDTPSYDEPRRGDNLATWHSWVDISLNPVAQVNLADSVGVTGNIPVGVSFLSDWASTITA